MTPEEAARLTSVDAAVPGSSFDRTLAAIHKELLEFFPDVSRIAVALYSAKSGRLRTFVHSSSGSNPLSCYDAFLDDVPSLAALARDRKERVIDDLAGWPAPASPHGRKIVEAGYRSSFTRPIFDGGRLLGFIFLDAPSPAYFSAKTMHRLRVFVQLVTLATVAARSEVRALVSAVELAGGLSLFRDRETSMHMERMARYSRLIAQDLAETRGLTDEFIDYLTLFAPLHDVGKLGVPDAVLQKPGILTPAEFDIMKRHVLIGVRIIDRMLEALGMNDRLHGGMLRNVVLYHHEAFDGSGYVGGLKGEAIPLEARITAVADIYDALTSERPYKEAWPAATALAFLAEQAGQALDPDCVAALYNCRAEAEAIGARPTGEDGERHFHEAYFDWL